MSLAFLTIAILIVTIVFGALSQVRSERRKLARQGIDDAHPACPNCLYRLGGWTAPICPECGTDVQESGVRVGAARRRVLAQLALAFGLVFVGLPVSFQVVAWLLKDSSNLERVELTSASDPSVGILLSLEGRLRTIPPLHGWTATIEYYDVPLQPLNRGVIGPPTRPDGTAVVPVATQTVAMDEAIPTTESIARIIAGLQPDGPVGNASLADTHADGIRSVLQAGTGRDLRARFRGGSTGNWTGLGASVQPPWRSGAMASSTVQALAEWRQAAMPLVTIGIVIFGAWLGNRFIAKRTDGGVRPIRGDEWRTAGTD